MRSRSRSWFLGRRRPGFVLSIPIAASARITQSDLVLVRADDVVTEDLYAAGNRISIEGRIEGDLIAAAFEEVVISGEVTGDVTVVAGRVTITGRWVVRSVPPPALVQVSGSIAEDLAVVSWETVLDPNGASRAGSHQLGAPRSDRRDRWDVTSPVAFPGLALDGEVGGSVDVNVGTLVIGAAAEVDGDVAYRSTREAEVEFGPRSGVRSSSERRCPPTSRCVPCNSSRWSSSCSS